MDWRLTTVFLGVLLTLGGCVSNADLDAVRRDVNALRQEEAGLAKANEGARALTEERLTKVENDLRTRFESSVKESEGSRAALSTRLEELATETRLVQGKLEENAFVVANLNTRLDEIDQRGRTTANRLDGLDQQVKTMGQQVRAATSAPPVAAPTGQPPAQTPEGTPAPASLLSSRLQRVKPLEPSLRLVSRQWGSHRSRLPSSRRPARRLLGNRQRQWLRRGPRR